MYRLRQTARQLLNIELTPLQTHAFRVYADILKDWPRNVSAINDPVQIEVKHFADSLTGVFAIRSILRDRHPILNAIPIGPTGVGAGDRLKMPTTKPTHFHHTLNVIDIATGAGFPSIPLYILYGPHARARLEAGGVLAARKLAERTAVRFIEGGASAPAFGAVPTSVPGPMAGHGLFPLYDRGLYHSFSLERLTLCDSQLQKCRFLDRLCTELSQIEPKDYADLSEAFASDPDVPDVVKELAQSQSVLDVSNVRIIQKRAESLAGHHEHAKAYDWAVIRALSPHSNELLRLSLPFLRRIPPFAFSPDSAEGPAPPGSQQNTIRTRAVRLMGLPVKSQTRLIGGAVTLFKGRSLPPDLNDVKGLESVVAQHAAEATIAAQAKAYAAAMLKAKAKEKETDNAAPAAASVEGSNIANPWDGTSTDSKRAQELAKRPAAAGMVPADDTATAADEKSDESGDDASDAEEEDTAAAMERVLAAGADVIGSMATEQSTFSAADRAAIGRAAKDVSRLLDIHRARHVETERFQLPAPDNTSPAEVAAANAKAKSGKSSKADDSDDDDGPKTEGYLQSLRGRAAKRNRSRREKEREKAAAAAAADPSTVYGRHLITFGVSA